MTLKIAFLALAALVAWFVLFRPRRAAPPGRPAKPGAANPRAATPPPTALERCPRCQVYRLPGGRCACDAPPAD